MTKKVCDLRGHDDLRDQLFLLKSFRKMEAKDGRVYASIIFADSSGEVDGRAWSNIPAIEEKCTVGEVVKISGKVNLYQGKLQIVVKDVEEAPTDTDKSEFIKTADRPAEKMYSELLELVEKLEDIYIKELLVSILSDLSVKERLLVWQAGKTIHHAYRSGLLEHILSCTHLAFKLSPVYETNLAYVVAGCILHDLAKIYELTQGPVVEYTDEGKLVGHLNKGVEILDRFSAREKSFPYAMKMHLRHILLSHHGSYEYGSPKLPQTKEAMLVHLIDYTDSKMNSFKTAAEMDKNQGAWTGYIKHLDRVVYKYDLPTFSTKRESGDKPLRGVLAKPPKAKKYLKSDPDPKTGLGGLLEGFNVKDSE